MQPRDEPAVDAEPARPGEGAANLEQNLAVLRAILLDDPKEESWTAGLSASVLRQFVAFLHENRLRVFLPLVLSDPSAVENLSAAECSRLSRYVQVQQDRRQDLEELLLSCSLLLRENGVEVLLLKSFHYCERFFPDPLVRPFDDVDILVRKDRFAAAQKALHRAGFRQIDAKPIIEPVIRLFEHSVTFERSGARLDLHWQLRNRPAYRLDADRIWRERGSLRLPCGTFAVLCDDDALTLSILETAGSIEQGGLRLKVLVDLFQILQAVASDLDWTRFFALRETEGILAISVNVLDLVVTLFGCEHMHPRLTAALARHENLLVTANRDDVLRLVRAQRSDPRNRIWYARCYAGNARWYAGWTVLSFVFRRGSGRALPSRSSIAYLFSSLFGTTRTSARS